MTQVTTTTLADGRELLYFDEDGSPQRTPSSDQRTLPARPATPELRQDPLTGDWITVATARDNRVHLPSADLDPLAPQSATNPSEIPDDYQVAVFENRSPSFGPGTGTTGLGLAELSQIGLERTARSIGRCEVVAFNPAHEGSFATQTRSRARTIIDAWAHRTAALQAIEGIEQVFVFENRGVDVGVTLHHPHGQIYSYPYVTPRTATLLAAIETYGGDLQADILEREAAGPRVIADTDHWVAFVPFAARWPVELHVMPKRHVPNLSALHDDERDDLAGLSLRVLRGLDAVYPTPMPYIAAWHQAPKSRQDVRLTWQITSPRRGAEKLKYLAGSEAAMGAWVADFTPETGADRLRAGLAAADAASPVEQQEPSSA